MSGSNHIPTPKRRLPRKSGLKIMVDSNILVSALSEPKRKIANLIIHVQQHERLYIPDYVIFETEIVLRRKYPTKLVAWKEFLKRGAFYVVKDPPESVYRRLPQINDPKDLAVVAAALHANVNFLVSGDLKHLHTEAVKVRIPTVTAAEMRRRLWLD